MSQLGAGLLAVSVGLIGLMATPALAAIPTPDADYRFSGTLKSSVNGETAPKLEKVGEGFAYDSRKVGGKTDKFLKWQLGAGLRLPNATTVLGEDANSDYTIALYLKLKNTGGYRKLIDFDNLLTDRGVYERAGYLYPYDVEGVEAPEEDPITAGKWHLIVVTRMIAVDEAEVVKGYVDGKRYYQLTDDENQQELGVDEVLHFLMDDESTGDEETAGSVSRIRIWQTPLTGTQAKSLNP